MEVLEEQVVKKERKKFSAETREKMRLAKLGRKQSPETITKRMKTAFGREPWNKGMSMSQEFKDKVSVGTMGKVLSQETKDRMSLAKKGQPSWRKGIPMTQETKEKIRQANLGRVPPNKGKPSEKKGVPLSEEHKEKLKEHHKNKVWTPEERAKYSHDKNPRGDKSPNWKGGIYLTNRKVRCSPPYQRWAKMTKQRDGWCLKCGEREWKKLRAHHILNFSSHPDLRFELSNSATLCKPCHSKFHSEFGRRNNNEGQLLTFLESD